MSNTASEAVAEKFEGFRPMLYLNTKEWWIQHLGEKRGTAVYVWIVAIRPIRRRGGAPFYLKFDHGNEYLDFEILDLRWSD